MKPVKKSCEVISIIQAHERDKHKTPATLFSDLAGQDCEI